MGQASWPHFGVWLRLCASLHSLRLYRCAGLTDAVLATDVLPYCTQLRSLEIARIDELRSPTIVSSNLCSVALVECEELHSPVLRCPRLSKLELRGSEHLVSPTVVSSDLRKLSLAGCRQLSHPTIECPSLSELDLSTCTALTAEAVQEQLESCRSITTLKLSGCRALRSLAISSLSLSSLHVCWCTHLQSIELTCSSLSSLHAYGCARLSRATVATGVGLRTLELQKCGSIDDPTLASLTSGPRASQLEVLNLTDCKALRQPRLNCARLRVLHLYNCLQLSSLVLFCPALELLNLTHCLELQSLELACPALATLLAAGCKRLTDETVAEMMRACMRLRTLDVKGCPLVSRQASEAAESLSQRPQPTSPQSKPTSEGLSSGAAGSEGVTGSRAAGSREDDVCEHVRKR
jgi:hypothetical protein